MNSSSSLVSNSNLITKVYFPRIILPASSVIVALVDFLITLILLAGVMIWYRYVPDLRILTLPLFTLLALIAALGPGLLITALNVKYRDFRYIVPFFVQFGLYVSPVGFSSSVISEKFGESVRLIYSLNPMVGVIDGFRWAIGGKTELHSVAFPLSTGFSFVLLWYGINYFRKTEKSFADVI
ncbi:MAG: ABC transporter permease [Nitrospira sp.]